MNPLHIEKAGTTPGIVLDQTKGVFVIEGKSLPENAMGFYQPVIEWLGEYLKNPNPSTELIFKMQYFNTASSKIIYDIICMLKEPHNKGQDVKVHWHYAEDDDDTLEAGEDYASLSNIPFKFSTMMN